MNIYVYSDESGVFDKVHNDYFVFGGVIFLGKEEKEKWERKYTSVESKFKKSLGLSKNEELKANYVSAKHKFSIYRSLNKCYKFAAVINEKRVLNRIFKNKKDKQRYLDYAYKIAIKNAFLRIIELGLIDPNDIDNIVFYVDEHTTATNGRYELREALERELKIGTYNMTYDHFFPPVFPKLGSVDLKFCDSATVRLIRAADIVANHFYGVAMRNNCDYTDDINQRNAFIKMLP